ncbi:hypothetical protein B296_00005016 [Ensete ventricosum]|uniref:Uncharacterized protein n=1 Tax=Ensete ventricosum TaxID=4639 RepID=A0A426Z2K7_ENSVE|nr:hypothetical protein B296_00005016 [Ensete ventricosum]
MRCRPQAWLAPAGVTLASIGSARSQAARGSHPRKAASPTREVSRACRKGDCPCRRRAAPPPTQGSGGGGIVRSLPDSFSHFIMNFHMSKFEVTLPELFNILREAESAIKKEKPVLYIGDSTYGGVTQEWEDIVVLKQVIERGEEATTSPVGLSYPKAKRRLERRWTRRSTTVSQRRIYQSRRKGCRCKATDNRAIGLVAPWYHRGDTSVESSILCSHGGRALVIEGAEEVENAKANSKYQDRVEG